MIEFTTTTKDHNDKVRARVEMTDVHYVECRIGYDDHLLLKFVDSRGEVVLMDLSRAAHPMLLKAFSAEFHRLSMSESNVIAQAAVTLTKIAERYKSAPTKPDVPEVSR